MIPLEITLPTVIAVVGGILAYLTWKRGGDQIIKGDATNIANLVSLMGDVRADLKEVKGDIKEVKGDTKRIEIEQVRQSEKIANNDTRINNIEDKMAISAKVVG